MSLATGAPGLERRLRDDAKRLFSGVVRGLAPRRVDWPLSTWRLSRDATGALALDGVALEALLAREGSPLHVVDATALAANAAAFRAVPTGAARGCEVFYSYKTNPVPGVLRLLQAHGIGAEAASDYELWLALHLGVPPKNIIFNGPTRTTESLALAIKSGVGLININWHSDIGTLAAVAPRVSKRIAVGIRVVPPGHVGGQFGERIDTGAALAAFRDALRCPELRVAALHAHHNSEIATLQDLDEHLSAVLKFTDVLRTHLGLELEILDLGGNLASPTVSRIPGWSHRLAVTFGCEPVPRPATAVLSIAAYVARVVARVGEHYAAHSRPPPRIFLEPGRSMTSNTQMLLCRVERVHAADGDGISRGVLDAGHNVAEPLSNEFHQLFPLTARPNTERRLYRLSGPTCTLADQLYPAWRMPVLEPGDAVAVMDSGAYFVPFGTCFSRPRPAVVAIVGGRVETFRRAETFQDLVAYDAPLRNVRPILRAEGTSASL